MTLGLDHALIAVDDLEAATHIYQHLGFQVIRGGQHPQHGTHNALVPLSDEFYLELMGVWDRSLASQYPHTSQIVEALDRDNRLALFALDSDNLDADVTAVRERGLGISDPVPGKRERPDGERVAWRTAHPDDPWLPFLIQDETPRGVRVPEAEEGIGTDLWAGWLAIQARDVDEIASRYGSFLGSPKDERFVVMDRGALLIEPGSLPFALHRLVLATKNLPGLAETWTARGVSFQDTETNDGKRVLIPQRTAGVSIRVMQLS